LYFSYANYTEKSGLANFFSNPFLFFTFVLYNVFALFFEKNFMKNTSLLAISGLVFLASCGTNNTTQTPQTAGFEFDPNNKNVIIQPSNSGSTTESTTSMSTDTTISDDETRSIKYEAPSGPVFMDVSAKVEDGVVKSVSVKAAENTDQMSANFIENFSKEISTKVIGQKISDLQNVDAIGGASLTTKAFVNYVSTL